MTIHAFPIPTGTRVSAFGRDDAVVTSQNGQTVHVVCLDGFGRAFTAAIPLSRLTLSRKREFADDGAANSSLTEQERQMVRELLADDVALIDRWSNAKSVMHGSTELPSDVEEIA
jgi:hypothetical protein